MKEKRRVEIRCSACGAETLLVRTPVYEGLTKVGETLQCATCKHEYPSEDAVPFKGAEKINLFTEADRSKKIDLFKNEEPAICRHCAHYVINPFTQWCPIHRKEVAATDMCTQFERKEEPSTEVG